MGFLAQALGGSLIQARRYDEAVELLRQTLALHPNFMVAHLRLGHAYGFEGRYPKALEAYQKAATLSDDPRPKAFMAGVYAFMGDRMRAEQLLTELRKAGADRRAPFAMARVYASLGDKEKAFEYLELAYERHANVLLVKVSPDLDPIRDDPRYQDLVRRMNFPE